MKRSRKWEYVKQEAIRLAGLGLSDLTIAKRLELDRTTVFRWRKEGKLQVEGALEAEPERVRMTTAKDQTAGQWAEAVRQAYDLDVTDDQLVTLAEAALLTSRDPDTKASLRLVAMGRFQALVKQLALVARNTAAKAEAPKRKTFAVQRRDGVDPRGLLEAVK